MNAQTFMTLDRINSFIPLKPHSLDPPEMYHNIKLKNKIFKY